MKDTITPSHFSGHVSQKDWKDSDELVECTVACYVGDKRYETVFMAQCPMTAIEHAQKNFSALSWEEKNEVAKNRYKA